MTVLQPTDWQCAHLPADAFGGWPLTANIDWRTAEVPGCVQTSPFGLPLAEVYQRDNVDRVRWMEAEYWLYRTTVAVPAFETDREAVYRFTGIDYACQIYVDGEVFTTHEGMFSPVEIPLTPGTHDLHVVLLPFVQAQDAWNCPPENMKARCTTGAGWDFAPKLQSRGIWDACGWLIRPKLRVTHAAVATRLNNQQRADVTINVTLSERVAYGRITVSLDGVARTFPVVETDTLALPLNIASPTLWWPNGMGEAALVDLELTLDVPGHTTEAFTQRTGLRTLDRVSCDGQALEDYPLQLVINGRKVFLKGVNWVPLDALPGTITSERYRLFLEQFRDAGVNIIRVWGGGLKEHEAFYRLADEYGLMVLQEFPASCQRLARTEKFYRLINQEVPAIIRQLQHHPCVVIWSGGNEHFHYWDRLDSGTQTMEAIKATLKESIGFNETDWLAGAARYDEPSLALMGDLCARMDPSRPYQLTSGMEGEGEVHGIWNWNPTHGDHRYRDYPSLYAFWRDAREHLYSEASVSSIANWETIQYVLGTETPSYPAKDDPIWKMHHAFQGVWDAHPDLWLDIPSTEALFGPISDLEMLILANQWMQGEGARFFIEELRRKMGHTCGVIWWGINEPWPGLAGNALIDYFGRPKLGWQFLANAYRPTILTLRYEQCVARRVTPEVWITHDGPDTFRGRYEITITDLVQQVTSTRYNGQVECAAGESRYLRVFTPIRLHAGTRLQVTCQLYAGDRVVHRNDYLFASNEDPVPFDATMRSQIAHLYRGHSCVDMPRTMLRTLI